MITEKEYTELKLKIQSIEDKLDDFIEKSNVSGVYTGGTPDYVREYVKNEQLRGDKE